MAYTPALWVANFGEPSPGWGHRRCPEVSVKVTSCFAFPTLHGIFMSSLPPRHPPIAAVEGLSNSWVSADSCDDCRLPSRRRRLPLGRHRRANPPTSTQSVADQLHGGQRRRTIPAQPRLDLPHLDIHPAQPLWHSPLGLPPVRPLKPPDAVGGDGPLAATPDYSRWMTVGGQAYYYVFHRPKL